MPGEDQEQFEDYIELENYVESLQAGKVAHPPKDLTPERVRIYQMATLFSSAADDMAEPRPEFVEQLKAQLLAMDKLPPQPQPARQEPPSNMTPPVAEPVQPPVPIRGKPKRAPFVSRRNLLTGGAIAAASLIAGAGIGYETHSSDNPTIGETGSTGTPPATQQPIQIRPETPTTWHLVTTLAELGNQPVRFASETLVGYVIRTPGTNTDPSDRPNSVIALSSACTHMGCLVQWKNDQQHFVCPCHGARFDELGALIPADYARHLPPLHSLNTKIEDDKVYVEVPT
jgi:Rieske Fe-S protein